MHPHRLLTLLALPALSLTHCSSTPARVAARVVTAPDASAGPTSTVARDASTPAQDAAPAPRRVASSLAGSINELGFALFATLNHEQNALLSPYDVSRALSLLELASDGETRDEIDRAMRFGDAERTLAEWPTLAQTLQRAARAQGFTLSSAARVWPSNTLTVLDSYRAAVGAQLGAPLVALDFAAAPEQQRQAINAWVSQETRQKIPELLAHGSVTSQTRLVLTTALYFMGRWRSAFDRRSTSEVHFFLSEERAKRVSMMTQTLVTRYAQDSDVRMVELDYVGDELAMDVLLPAPGQTLRALLARLDSESFARWVAQARRTNVTVELPRITLRHHLPLGDALDAVGVRSALSDRANLRRLTTSEQPSFNRVVHEVYVAIDESGTEAAAATASVGYGSSRPLTFSVNQPFVFAIRHRPTGAVLFLGSVVDPAPAAQSEPAAGSPLRAGAPSAQLPTISVASPAQRVGRVRTATPTVRGARSSDEVRRIVHGNLSPLSDCHQRGLELNPDARGRVVVTFAIGPDGRVLNATANDEFPVRETRECIRRVFNTLVFPRIEASTVIVQFPIDLDVAR